MRIIASRVGRSWARPPIGASALGVAARIYALAARRRAGMLSVYDRTICPSAREEGARARAPFFAGYTEGIINICYSTYSARAAPFHPTMRHTGRTLNTLSPSLYVQAARTHARTHMCTRAPKSSNRSARDQPWTKENFYLRSACCPCIHSSGI